MSKDPYVIEKQKEAMIDALELHYGNIKKAADAAGICPRTHFRWMKLDADYERKADSSRDVGYRNLKDNIIEMALRKAEKGNTTVLNQLMRLFLKNMPDEMKALNRWNNVPLTPRIRYVDTREEAQEIMKRRGESGPDGQL